LYPAAAVLVGRWVAERAKQKARYDWPLVVFSLLLGVFYIAFSNAVRKLGLHWNEVSLLSAVAFGALVTGNLAQTLQWRWLIPGVATSLLLLVAWCSPVWKVKETEISERLLTRAAPPGQTIYALGLKKPSLRYYATRPVVFSDDHAQAQADIARHSGRVYAMRPEDLDAMRPQVSANDYTILQAQRRTILLQATPPATEKLPEHDTTPTP
ncbi:MAG: hypothetical protein M3Y13_04395, partial [Armatimonadota bacterium]|nr:hypothetical protein [Armatimonadota bacterium]